MAKRTGNCDDLIPESVIFRKTPTKKKRITSSNDENEVINSHINDSDVTHISEAQLTQSLKIMIIVKGIAIHLFLL